MRARRRYVGVEPRVAASVSVVEAADCPYGG